MHSLQAPGLTNMPWEVSELILSDSFMAPKDLGALRLTCKTLAQRLDPIVFSEVHISSLLRDRERFLAIASSPKLAQHARVLVWNELSGFYSSLSATAAAKLFSPARLASANQQMDYENAEYKDNKPLFEDLLEQMRALVGPWATRTSPTDQDGDVVRGDGDEDEPLQPLFNMEFSAALDAMPGIHTFISRPMRPARLVQAAPHGYPLTVQLLQRFLHFESNGLYFEPDSLEPQPRNIGFTSFLMPALHQFALNGRRSITTLRVEDEYVGDLPVTNYIGSSYPAAFLNLMYLDLCVSPLWHAETQISSLRLCLEQAKNLRHLRLYCQQEGWMRKSGAIWDSLGCVLLEADPPSRFLLLPQLESLHLEDVNLENEASNNYPVHSHLPFTTFIEHHAGTLRDIYIGTTVVSRKVLFELANLNKLQLRRFVMVPVECEAETETELINEEEVLQFLNRNDSFSISPEFPWWLKADTKELRTHNAHGYFYGNGKPSLRHLCQSSYESGENMDLDHEWIESSPGAIDTHSPLLSLDDLHIGVQEDGIDVAHDANQEFGSREQSEAGRDEDRGCLSHHKPNHMMTGQFDERPVYSSEICVRENADHVARLDAAPMWSWGRDVNHNVWYWQLPEGEGGGHSTELWHFIHRYGEQTYGNEPLDFWPDWKGQGSGDVSEPTPFGWWLYLFARRIQIASKSIDMDGPVVNLEMLRDCGIEPVLYRKEEDPMCDFFDVRQFVAWPAAFTEEDMDICRT